MSMKQFFKLVLTATLLLTSLLSFAQRSSVTGKITDSSGNPLIGATVIVQGTSTGSVTDIDGSYSLALSPGSYTLDFSYTGYDPTSQTVTIGQGATTLNVKMVAGGN